MDLLSYPRGVIATVFGIVQTLLMSIFIISLSFVSRHRPTIDWFINNAWCRAILWVGGIRLEVRGADLVTASKKGYLILFNHSSLMDIPALCASFPRTFRFGAKIELFKIPFFGKVMEVCGVLPIDRHNRNKVMAVYEQAISRVNNGESFALAPEGTRQKQPVLGKFKRGPFEFAMNAKAQIVPVVIVGAFEVLPPKAILLNAGKWRRTITVEITPPVETEGYTLENVQELQDLVRARMADTFDRLRSERGAGVTGTVGVLAAGGAQASDRD